MRFRIYFTASLLLAIAIIAMALLDASLIAVSVTGAVFLAVLALTYHSVAKPLNAVQNGIYLLREQDFSSRLRNTGQSDADKVVDLFNDLMDTMKAERLRNKEQNRFMSLLIEASPMGIAICDFDNKIIQVNPAYRRLVTPDIARQIEGIRRNTSATIRSDNSQILRCSRHFFMDSGFMRSFILVEQLTDEIVLAEKQVFHKIIRTLGHEVNNTFGTVNSVLETLADIHADEPMIHDTIKSCHASGTNLVRFVKTYTDIVKLPDPVKENIDMSNELDTMMPTLRSMTPDNIKLNLHLPDGPVHIMADMMLMERVITNIVKNAVESIGTREDGVIDLTLYPDRRLEISDNGAGISDESASKLFTPFFSTKRPDRGVGLMLIADILRAHGARFTLRTDPQTHLTTFAIIFKQ